MEESMLYTSHLFTVRVWPEELEPGRVEWRSQVEHVMSGQARYFRRWSDLVEFMTKQLLDLTTGQTFEPDDPA
jgi:hypothetical protein